mgnify:CR=1 FL=1
MEQQLAQSEIMQHVLLLKETAAFWAAERANFPAAKKGQVAGAAVAAQAGLGGE